jgi:hypothetical protein
MRVINICHNYFTPLAIKDAHDQPFSHKKTVTALKIASYLIPVFPIIFGILYGIAKWVHRYKKVEILTPDRPIHAKLTKKEAVAIRAPLNKIKVLLFAVFHIQVDIDTIRKKLNIPDFPEDFAATEAKIVGVLDNFQVLTNRIFGEGKYFRAKIVEFEVSRSGFNKEDVIGDKAKYRMIRHILLSKPCNSYYMDFNLLDEDIKNKQKKLKLTLYPKGDNPFLNMQLITLHIYQVFHRKMESEDVMNQVKAFLPQGNVVEFRKRLDLILNHLETLHTLIYPNGFSHQIGVSYEFMDPVSRETRIAYGQEKTNMILYILQGNAYDAEFWDCIQDRSGDVTLVWKGLE